MPTSATNTYTFTRVDPLFAPEGAMETIVNVKIAASQTYAAGTVVGEVTASPGTYKAYATGNVDGTQNPTGILQYAVTTDASSNITSTSEWGFTSLATPMYIRGTFRTQDLTGLDAGAITKLGGHLVEGTVSSGIVTF
jgi:hypothetical protein